MSEALYEFGGLRFWSEDEIELREMASCSIRNDFSGDTKVCEIAIGLCRVATLASQ